MSETNGDAPNPSETEQPVEEKKKNKKPLIIGGILGGAAVIAIGAIVLSTTGNGGIIPIDKSYTTAIIDGKEYKNTNAIAIVDGVEVSDITKLASLTENTNKEAYICRSTWAYQGLGGNVELNNNSLPILYWSNMVDVPKEYQLDFAVKANSPKSDVRIALPKPELTWKVLGADNASGEQAIIDETTGKAGEGTIVSDIATVDGYDYKCETYTSSIAFTKWAQAERLTGSSGSQKAYVVGFQTGIDYTAFGWNDYETIPSGWTNDMPMPAPLMELFKDGLKSFYDWSLTPNNTVIPKLPNSGAIKISPSESYEYGYSQVYDSDITPYAEYLGTEFLVNAMNGYKDNQAGRPKTPPVVNK